MYLRLVSWGLRNRRWRHVMNLITMTITAAVVMLFVSVMAELVAYVNNSKDRELTRVQVFPKMFQGDLPLSIYPMLKEIPGVQVVQRFRHMSGRHESGAMYLVIGEEESGIELNTDFFPVEPEVFEAWKKEKPMGAIVTEQTARDLRLQVGQLAEVPTSSGPIKLKIVGLSKGGRIGQRIAGHFEYFQQFLGNPGTCRYRMFMKPGDFEAVAREVEARTRNSATPLQAVSMSQFAASWARRAGTVPAVLGFLGLFLIFTTALTLANNSAIAVSERRTEIATLRVLGFRRGTIVAVMLGEVMLIGLLGGILAIGLTKLIFGSGIQLTPGATQLLPPVQVGLSGIIAGLVTALVIPVAGALPAVWRAVRMPLVVALRDG